MQFNPVTFALAAVLLLAGCGQMGPLYEPGASAATPAKAPATTP